MRVGVILYYLLYTTTLAWSRDWTSLADLHFDIYIYIPHLTIDDNQHKYDPVGPCGIPIECIVCRDQEGAKEVELLFSGWIEGCFPGNINNIPVTKATTSAELC